MTAADLVCRSIYADEWSRIQVEGEMVRNKLHSAGSFIRLGDGELNILRRQDYLSDRLRAAVAACDILGLPDAFNRRPHPWRASLLKELSPYDGPVVSAVLPLCLPSLLPSVLKGRRALWITHRADVIIRRLKDPGFCEFYGFETGREDAHLTCVPRGRTLPYVEASEAGYLGVLDKVCREADEQTYDVAVIGMGAIGKMVAHHLSSKGKVAFDAGCILSALRSEPDRVVFTKELKPLLWVEKAPFRSVLLVLRSGGEYRPEHVLRLAAQIRDCQVSVLTDVSPGEFPGLHVIPMRHRWPGWWSKMELFRPDLTGTFLYLDLDTVVRKLPDAYFQHPQSLALQDFMQAGQKPPTYRQSSMMLLHEKDRAQVWEQWIADPAKHMREHRGDQDFLSLSKLNTATWQSVFPGEICSYKMHWLPKRGVEEKTVNVVCFHGKPKPWEVPETPAMLQRRPQSCVLVGNGPSILNHQLGTVIDGFDEVVRFNAFAICGFEDRVGTKTTLWSTFGHKTLPKDEGVRPERVLFTHGAGGEPAYSPRELIRIPSSAYSLVRKLVQARSKLPETGHLIPSSGLLVAWWYLEAMRMEKISLIGFDHFSKASDSRHHYWNPQIFTKPKEHDGEAEAAIIQDYIGAGRIERLG